MHRPRVVGATAFAVSLMLGAAPALAASATPTPTPAPAPTATISSPRPVSTPPPVSVLATPTASGPSATQLAADDARQQRALAGARRQLTAAGASAAATLEAYQTAQREAALTARQAQLEAAAYAVAAGRSRTARDNFDGYVGRLYRTGLTDPRMLMLSTVLAAPDTQNFFSDLVIADRIGASQSRTLNGLAAAEAAQSAKAKLAQTAQALAGAAAVRAAVAKLAADEVVAGQAARVDAATAALIDTQGALAFARVREAHLAAAELLARQHAAARPPTGVPCRGDDVSGYPNGTLPVTGLCPLWGTTGQVLRADAAAAFDALSHEYAAEFSRPICVTDSYRDYASQVVLRAAKPTLAAVPGTSNHGWGVAVDLCDGIQTFGSPTHDWMLANSMRFGWFHPTWAEPTGSKPEPWHWEYAGTAIAAVGLTQLSPPAVPAAGRP